jgi:hypothetical protein
MNLYIYYIILSIITILLLYFKKYIFLFIIFIMIFLPLFYHKYSNNVPNDIFLKDIKYISNSFIDNSINSLLNNNIILHPSNKHNNLLLLSIDDRPELDYVKIHNQNISNFATINGFHYKFITKTSYDVYWSKLYIILDLLENNNYDYIFFLDSDSIILDNNFNINNILNSYNSDIFISHDNFTKYSNAGIFIIKNSSIGKQFLKDCINSMDIRCINSKKNINGIWAATCYEQGQMNLQIINKYYKYTTLLDRNYFLNSMYCMVNNNKKFILHLYNNSKEKRSDCFKKLLN